MSNSAITQFQKFLLVGFLNTCFGYGVFAVLLFLGIHYTVAILLAYCIGIIFNFNTIGNFVFQQFDYVFLGKFILIYCVSYLVNIILIKFLHTYISNLYLVGAIVTGLIAFPVFLLNKHFVFTRSHLEYSRN